MNTLKFFLIVSIATNVVLAVIYLRPQPAPVPRPPAAVTRVAAPISPLTREQEIAAALRANPEFAAAVQSGDPRRLREALKQSGFPDTYVRDMVTFFTGNSVTPEHLALLREQARRPFWNPGMSEEALALQKLIRERDEKNTALTKEIFGGQIPPHPLEALNQQRKYRFLPADKMEAVIRIDADYADLEAANRMPANTEARVKARLVQEEKRKDLAKVLTPEELELYDLNVSFTAQNMRRQLALFQATEAEFRALYQIRREFDEKYGMGFGSMDQATMKQRAAEQEAVNQRARTLLGEPRYLEYIRAQDYGYRAAVEITSHFNLSPANAAETYTVQQTLMPRATAINALARTDRAAAAAQATALLTEANAQLTKLLGPAGVDAFKKTGGFWLRALEQTATQPADPARRSPGG